MHDTKETQDAYYKKEEVKSKFGFKRKRNIFIPEAPRPAAVPRLTEPAEAPNAMLRALLQSAKQQYVDLPTHGINLLNCLAEGPVIDVERLRKLSFLGIPDEINGLRPIIWRILLGYLPADVTTWDNILREQRTNYEIWKEELIVKPSLQHQQAEKEKMDHPLSNKNTSLWKRFYEDKNLWEEIEKDVKRTRVELAFFYMALDSNRVSKEDFDRLEK